MPLVVKRIVRLEWIGSVSVNDDCRFAITLADGNVLYGIVIQPHFPSIQLALDPQRYPAEVKAAVEEVYELLLQQAIADNAGALAKNPSCFTAEYAALTPQQQAEQIVRKDGVEAVITSSVECDAMEVIVQIGNSYTGTYYREVRYDSPVVELAVA